MITVSKQQFQDWIKAQPDDRKVDMAQCYRHEPCGCVMVQFGEDNGFQQFEHCGGTEWSFRDVTRQAHRVIEAKLDGFHLRDVIKGGFFNENLTYGELKKDLL